MSGAYVSPSFSRRERKRAMRALMGGPKMRVPNDPGRRWPAASLLFIATVLAVAGFLKGGFYVH